MADEQDKWLDRETAERLLRGEPPYPADTDGADPGTERLAQTLAALRAPAAPDAETPGEQAALAAFRAARTAPAYVPDGADRPVILGAVRGGRHAARGALQPSGHRPLVRLGLSAALAAGMLGGVAVAATTGVLRSPFGEADPAPAASSATGPMSGEPYASPPQDGPSGSTTAPDGGASASGTATPGASGDASPPGTAHDGHSARWWSGVTADCEELRDGGRLSDDSRRTLADAAGGSSRVGAWCETVLDDETGGPGRGTSSPGHGTGTGGDRDGGSGQGGRADSGGDPAVGTSPAPSGIRSDGPARADQSAERTNTRTGEATSGTGRAGSSDGTVHALVTAAESPTPAKPARAAKGGKHRKPSGKGGAHAAAKGPRAH